MTWLDLTPVMAWAMTSALLSVSPSASRPQTTVDFLRLGVSAVSAVWLWSPIRERQTRTRRCCPVAVASSSSSSLLLCVEAEVASTVSSTNRVVPAAIKDGPRRHLESWLWRGWGLARRHPHSVAVGEFLKENVLRDLSGVHPTGHGTAGPQSVSTYWDAVLSPGLRCVWSCPSGGCPVCAAGSGGGSCLAPALDVSMSSELHCHTYRSVPMTQALYTRTFVRTVSLPLFHRLAIGSSSKVEATFPASSDRSLVMVTPVTADLPALGLHCTVEPGHQEPGSGVWRPLRCPGSRAPLPGLPSVIQRNSEPVHFGVRWAAGVAGKMLRNRGPSRVFCQGLPQIAFSVPEDTHKAAGAVWSIDGAVVGGCNGTYPLTTVGPAWHDSGSHCCSPEVPVQFSLGLHDKTVTQ